MTIILNTLAMLLTAIIGLLVTGTVASIIIGTLIGIHITAEAFFPGSDSFVQSEIVYIIFGLIFICYFIVSTYQILTGLCPLIYSFLKRKEKEQD